VERVRHALRGRTEDLAKQPSPIVRPKMKEPLHRGFKEGDTIYRSWIPAEGAWGRAEKLEMKDEWSR